MKEINGSLALTIRIIPGELYKVNYDKAAIINVVNYTDGSVYVAEKPEFDFIDNVGNFLTVTDGNSYNDYQFYSRNNSIYVKVDENVTEGTICLIRKQW